MDVEIVIRGSNPEEGKEAREAELEFKLWAEFREGFELLLALARDI